MQLKRLLIVPGQRLTGDSPRSAAKKLFYAIQSHLAIGPITHQGELQYFGDIPDILGPTNTFFYSRPFDHRLYRSSPEPNCPYPSCHGLPQGTFITARQLTITLKQCQAILVSATAGERGRQTINLARRYDIPVAILDRLDHEAIYGSTNIARDIHRTFLPAKDFEIYFKQDLPLGYATDSVLPISPLPIRPAAYTINQDPLKKSTIFYSGRPRYDISQADKQAIIEKIQQSIPETDILLHTSRKTFITNQEYFDRLTRAHIALSPSCRVWDSFRHCEVGLSATTALLAPKPYSETCGPQLRNDENAILYHTSLKEGKHHLDDPDIVDKIKHYLSHPDQLLRLARQWHQDVTTGHTTAARAQYLVNAIQQRI